MEYCIFIGFIVLVSFLLAKVEINIEGEDGYAKNLPVTWRASRRWVKELFGGTSYHIYMWGLLLALMHLPFVVGLSWSTGAEMTVVSFLLLVTVLEDFLWFVLNPVYGVKKFKQHDIPWFKDRWAKIVPAWYLWYLPVGIGLYVGAKLL